MKKNVLSQQLKKLREQKGWSYRHMGTVIGVDYRRIKGYEEDGKMPEIDILERYADKFGVTFEYLYYGIEISDLELYNKFSRLSEKQRKAVMAVIESY